MVVMVDQQGLNANRVEITCARSVDEGKLLFLIVECVEEDGALILRAIGPNAGLSIIPQASNAIRIERRKK